MNWKILAAIAVMIVALAVWFHPGKAVVTKAEDLGIGDTTQTCSYYGWCMGMQNGHNGQMTYAYGYRLCTGSQRAKARFVRETFYYEKKPTVTRTRIVPRDIQPVEDCS